MTYQKSTRGEFMRCFACSVALLLLLLLLAGITGCGGGGGTPATPVGTGSVEGYIYANQSRSRMLVSKKTLIARTMVSLGVGTRDSTGSALNGAIVAVRGYASLTATTDATGHFRIDKVPTGSQTLLVSDTGFASLTVPVTIVANTLTEAGNVALPTTRHTWTVMVYLNANLTGQDVLPDAMNYQQMEAAPESPINPATQGAYVETLVQYAKAGQGSTPTTCNIDEIHHSPGAGQSASIIRQTLGSNVDMGNPTTLQTFINWCQTNEPADHYLLVIWDHGSGWDPASDSTSVRRTTKNRTTPAPIRERAISFDDLHNSCIRDIDLPTALTTKAPIDIVATDACLMSMLEVGYEIRHQANFLIGSEDETPAEGYNYTDIVTKLVNSYQTITPSVYAAYLAQDAFTYWTVQLGYNTETVTSSIDLSQMDAAASALGALSNALIANVKNNPAQYATAEKQVARFSPDSILSPTGYPPFADLYDYAAQLNANVQNSTVQNAAIGVENAVTAAVNSNSYTTDGTYPRAHGISIYLPDASDYLNPSPYYGATPASSYPQLELAQKTTWAQWLAIQP